MTFTTRSIIAVVAAAAVLAGATITLVLLLDGSSDGADVRPVGQPVPSVAAASTSNEPSSDAVLPSPSSSPTSSPSPVPQPAATFSGTCDYTLQPYQVVGSVDVTNTGNVDVTVEVTINWRQVGYEPITMTTTATVGVGEAAVVQFHHDVSMAEISRIQSWLGSHSQLCTYDSTVLTSPPA